MDPLALSDGVGLVDDNGQNADILDGDAGPHPSSPLSHHKCPHCLKVFQNFAVSLLNFYVPLTCQSNVSMIQFLCFLRA